MVSIKPAAAVNDCLTNEKKNVTEYENENGI